MPLYLGLDSSTQSLTAIVIEDRPRQPPSRATSRRSSSTRRCRGTGRGTACCRARTRAVAVSSPVMWAEALELMMARVAQKRARASRRLAGDRRVGAAARQRLPESRLGRAARVAQSGQDRSPSQVPAMLARDRCRRSGWTRARPSSAGRSPPRVGGARVLRRTPARARSSASPVRRFGKLFKQERQPYLSTGPRSSGQLVPGVAARRPACAARSGRCVGHEPDGPDRPASGGPPALDATAPDLASRLPSIAPVVGRCRPLAPFWQPRVRPAATRASSPGPATIRAA